MTTEPVVLGVDGYGYCGYVSIPGVYVQIGIVKSRALAEEILRDVCNKIQGEKTIHEK